MKLIRNICIFIDALNTLVGRFVAWATALLVAVVFVDVVMRYLFKTSYVFTQEFEWQLFAFIFLMGAGYTLLLDGHVRVDIFYQRMSTRTRAWVNLLGVLFFLIPGCLMIIITSYGFAMTSFTILEGSPDPGGIPYRWLIKSCIPVGFILVLLQGVSMGIKNLFTLLNIPFNKDEPEGKKA
ncbi:MAG: TRAP transporter small permease subunit [Desulfobacteraceae bacterium]|nr:MAG: TRAP transporter small permease subunit [Desulfobacteraceae bacterium]